MRVDKQSADKYGTIYIELNINGNQKLTIVKVYRLYRLLFDDENAFCGDIQSTKQNKHEIIILDFNCPIIRWDSMNGGGESNMFI